MAQVLLTKENVTALTRPCKKSIAHGERMIFLAL